MAEPLIPLVGVQSFGRMLARGLTVYGLAQVHLYQNPYVPIEGTTALNLVECTFPGYAPATLLPALGAGFLPPATWWQPFAPVVFTRGVGIASPQICYGYWISCLDPVSAVAYPLVWVQLFPAPFVFINPGDVLAFAPSLADLQAF